MRNKNDEIKIARHLERAPRLTVRHQLSVASQNFHHHMDEIQLATSRSHLIAFSARDLPSPLPSFAGLSQGVLQQTFSPPLRWVKSFGNERFSYIPQDVLLSSHRPCRTTQQDRQARISGRIGRQSIDSLLVCLMGSSNCDPDSERLLRFSVQPDFITKKSSARVTIESRDI